MDGGVVVLLLEVMAADWNAHVPDVAVAVIAAKSAVEVIAKKSADGFYTEHFGFWKSASAVAWSLKKYLPLPSVNYGSPFQVEWPATFVPLERVLLPIFWLNIMYNTSVAT
eukprot:scaffold2482_cov145-Skeletonema_dohrnii-CCMP3373.AAC.2